MHRQHHLKNMAILTGKHVNRLPSLAGMQHGLEVVGDKDMDEEPLTPAMRGLQLDGVRFMCMHEYCQLK